MEKFLNDEHKANTSRARPVEPEFFYTPDLDTLPFRDNAEGDIAKEQERLSKAAQLKMVKFPKKMTNLELKSAYGLANLEIVTGYEENYSRYISILIDWAVALLDHGGSAEKEDAIRLLEKAIELGSGYRKSYLLLADHYASRSDAEAMNHLLDRISETFSDEGIKQQLTKHIMELKENF